MKIFSLIMARGGVVEFARLELGYLLSLQWKHCWEAYSKLLIDRQQFYIIIDRLQAWYVLNKLTILLNPLAQQLTAQRKQRFNKYLANYRSNHGLPYH